MIEGNNKFIFFILLVILTLFTIYINLGIWPKYRVNSYDQLTQLFDFLYSYDPIKYSHFPNSALSKLSITDELLFQIKKSLNLDFYYVIFIITFFSYLSLIVSIFLIINLLTQNNFFSVILTCLLFLTNEWNFNLIFLQRTIAFPLAIISFYFMLKEKYILALISCILSSSIDLVVSYPFIILFFILISLNLFKNQEYKKFLIFFSSIIFLIFIFFMILNFIFNIPFFINPEHYENIIIRKQKVDFIDKINYANLLLYAFNIYFVIFLLNTKINKVYLYKFILFSLILFFILSITPTIFYSTKISILYLINTPRLHYFIILMHYILLLTYIYFKSKQSFQKNFILIIIICLLIHENTAYFIDAKNVFIDFNKYFNDLFNNLNFKYLKINYHLLIISLLLIFDWVLDKIKYRKYLFLFFDLFLFIILLFFLNIKILPDFNILFQEFFDLSFYVKNYFLNNVQIFLFFLLPTFFLCSLYFRKSNTLLVYTFSLIVPFIFYLNYDFRFSISPTKYIELDQKSNLHIIKLNNDSRLKKWSLNNTNKNDVFYYLDYNSPKDSQEGYFIALLERNMYFNFTKGSAYSAKKLKKWKLKYEKLNSIISKKNFIKFRDLGINYLIIDNKYFDENILKFSNYKIVFINKNYKILELY